MSEQRAQLAYETFAESYRNSGGSVHQAPWQHLPPLERSHWIAAARALALDRTTEPQRPTEQVVLLKFDASNLDSLLERCNHTGAVAEWGRRVDVQYKSILEAIMKTRTDLDAGIATLEQEDIALLQSLVTLSTNQKNAFADLKAAIAANPGAPVEDFQAEFDAVDKTNTDFASALTQVQALTAAATSNDPGPQKTVPTATTLTIVASPDSPDDTTTVTLSGSVVGGPTTATGSVSISDSTGAVSTTASLDGAGAFNTTVGPLQAGTYTLNATYGGDAANASSSGSVAFTVVPASNVGQAATDNTVKPIPGGPVTEV